MCMIFRISIIMAFLAQVQQALNPAEDFDLIEIFIAWDSFRLQQCIRFCRRQSVDVAIYLVTMFNTEVTREAHRLRRFYLTILEPTLRDPWRFSFNKQGYRNALFAYDNRIVQRMLHCVGTHSQDRILQEDADYSTDEWEDSYDDNVSLTNTLEM